LTCGGDSDLTGTDSSSKPCGGILCGVHKLLDPRTLRPLRGRSGNPAGQLDGLAVGGGETDRVMARLMPRDPLHGATTRCRHPRVIDRQHGSHVALVIDQRPITAHLVGAGLQDDRHGVGVEWVYDGNAGYGRM
jgi:hypothetical protein